MTDLKTKDMDVYRVETYDGDVDLEAELSRIWDLGWKTVSVIPIGLKGDGWLKYQVVLINRYAEVIGEKEAS